MVHIYKYNLARGIIWVSTFIKLNIKKEIKSRTKQTNKPKIRLIDKVSGYIFIIPSLLLEPLSWAIKIKEEDDNTVKETIKIFVTWFTWPMAFVACGIPANINWFI